MINNKTPSQYITGLYLIFHHFYNVISTYFILYLAIIVENLHMKPWETLSVMHLYDTFINNRIFYKILPPNSSVAQYIKNLMLGLRYNKFHPLHYYVLSIYKLKNMLPFNKH
jgi:hypothetical protein